MSIIDPTTGVDEDSSPVSVSQCYTKTFPTSAPIRVAVLPAAMAGYARQDAISRILNGSLTPRILQMDDPPNAGRDRREASKDLIKRAL